MARKNQRNAGLWFLGILGLILTAIGFRYASSSGWWTDVFGGGPQLLQTVNTGASVFMPTTASPAPSPSPNITPPNTVLPDSSAPTTPSPPATGSNSGFRRMW